ncbi:hypothetical protein A3F37_00390 [Candidatus Saccharibacteria bacterium RIFCSPHIGHO2_12_FULL_41_12]|nr:MAG: hypothetical protein A3F37_00390 [Candidatus Saccharibacteria bacterium RIFCSPHIGHO2_12_FULL_41_12]
MRKQSPLAVFLLILITFGIYGIVWTARTRGEMVRKGADIPTTWLIIIPLVNYWYFWKWSAGVGLVTKKLDPIMVFLLIILLGGIGSAIIQDSFNSVGEAEAPSSATPSAPSQQETSETTVAADSEETSNDQSPQPPAQL